MYEELYAPLPDAGAYLKRIGLGGEAPEPTVEWLDRLVHAHLATMPNRKAPGIEPYDFVPFFRALAAAGYDGRVSVEGGLPPPEGRVAALRESLGILRAARDAAVGG